MAAARRRGACAARPSGCARRTRASTARRRHPLLPPSARPASPIPPFGVLCGAFTNLSAVAAVVRGPDIQISADGLRSNDGEHLRTRFARHYHRMHPPPVRGPVEVRQQALHACLPLNAACQSDHPCAHRPQPPPTRCQHRPLSLCCLPAPPPRQSMLELRTSQLTSSGKPGGGSAHLGCIANRDGGQTLASGKPAERRGGKGRALGSVGRGLLWSVAACCSPDER